MTTANPTTERTACCDAPASYDGDGTLYCKACYGEVTWAEPAYVRPKADAIAAAAVAIRDTVDAALLREPVAEVAVQMALRALTAGTDVDRIDYVHRVAADALAAARVRAASTSAAPLDVWEVVAIEWTADDGTTVLTFSAEGTAPGVGWFCFETETAAEMQAELAGLGFADAARRVDDATRMVAS